MSAPDLPWTSPIVSGLWPWVPALALAGLAWAWHVRHLLTRERRLLQALGRLTPRAVTPAVPTPARSSEPIEAHETGNDAPAPRVLVIARAAARDDLSLRLASQGLTASFADSAWSARAAWQDAVLDDRPYNLILVDEACGDVGASDLADELQREFEQDGARVGTIRVHAPVAAEPLAGWA